MTGCTFCYIRINFFMQSSRAALKIANMQLIGQNSQVQLLCVHDVWERVGGQALCVSVCMCLLSAYCSGSKQRWRQCIFYKLGLSTRNMSEQRNGPFPLRALGVVSQQTTIECVFKKAIDYRSVQAREKPSVTIPPDSFKEIIYSTLWAQSTK